MPEDDLVLVNKSSYRTRDIPMAEMCEAINRQLVDFADAWGAITWTLTRDLRRQGFRIVLLDNTDEAEAMAYHDVTPAGPVTRTAPNIAWAAVQRSWGPGGIKLTAEFGGPPGHADSSHHCLGCSTGITTPGIKLPADSGGPPVTRVLNRDSCGSGTARSSNRHDRHDRRDEFNSRGDPQAKRVSEGRPEIASY